MGANARADIPGSHTMEVLVPARAQGDATQSQPIFRAPFAGRIKKVMIVPAAAITGQATNTFNLNLIRRGTDGSGTTEIANRDYLAGTNEAAYVKRDLYTPASPLAVPEGEVIDLQRELVGTGLATPALLVQVEFEAQ